MQISRILTVAAAVAVTAGVAGLPARADLKLVQSTVIDSPQIKAMVQSMTPEQRAQLGKMGFGGTIVTTTYVKGSKARADVGQSSIIVDTAAKKSVTLNRAAHTYAASPYNPAGGPRAGQVTASIKPTGKTRSILGHRCRDYHFAASNIFGPGSTATGEMWVAADLPRPAVELLSGPSNPLQNIWKKIPGLPLQTSATVTGTMAGNMKINSVAKSVSTAPVPSSVFAIPAGYKPGPAGFGPMGGFGGGMPAGGGAPAGQ